MINFIKLLMIFAISISISACGKMANPEPIEGSGYPHSYPRS